MASSNPFQQIARPMRKRARRQEAAPAEESDEMGMDFQVENTSIECAKADARSSSDSIEDVMIVGHMELACSVERQILFTPVRNEDIHQQRFPEVAASETTLPAREPFRLLDLPVELLMLTLAPELYIGQNDSAPPILVCLGASRYKNLYREAQRVYRRINFKATPQNEAAFRNQRMSEILKIKHIKIVLPVRLRAHKMILWNNLETITIDHSQEEIYHDLTRYTSTSPVVAFLVEASKKVRKVILTATPSPEHRVRFGRIEHYVTEINKGLELTASHDTCRSDHSQTWTWENEGGRTLRWRSGRGFGKDY